MQARTLVRFLHNASPGKAAEPVRAADSNPRWTCTKGRASMLTHRGPESSPR